MQGGIFEDLRLHSAAFLSQLAFPGYAIGGLAVGETKGADVCNPRLYLWGPARRSPPPFDGRVGAPEDIVEAVFRGVDFFDCVLPTRIARNGQAADARWARTCGMRSMSRTAPGAGRLPLLYMPHL